MTNRELYLALNAMAESGAARGRWLEEYLGALLMLVRGRAEAAGVSGEVFVGMLREALTGETVRYEEVVGMRTLERSGGRAGVEETLVRQIVDLREMREAGVYENEMRSFGVNAPRGGRWYNFSVESFLECGAAGWFGGWEPGDPGGRDFVPGEVAVMNEKGEFVGADPREVQRRIEEVVEISWEDVRGFLGSGQAYE